MTKSRLERVLRALLVVAFPVGAMMIIVAGPTLAEDVTPSPSASASASASAVPSAPSPTLSVPQATAVPLPSLVPAPPLPTPLTHPGDGQSNSCYDCHREVNPNQQLVATDWQDSVHGKAGIGCADCHGGDPTSDQITVAMAPSNGYIGVPGRDATVGLCGACHSDVERMRAYNLPTDQYAKYFSSVHGQRLAASGDTVVAICTDCHGVHDISKISDPTARVYPANVPELCASCHADSEKMERYGIPTDQYEIYQQSVHGKALLEQGDIRAPSCASCHGSHDAKPPRSTEVVEVCGKCHTATQALYEQSRHAQLGSVAPKCWTCHGTHDVSQPGERLFLHTDNAPYSCATCHDPVTQQLRIEATQFENEADRRCDTCHHPNSTIYAQVKGIATALSDAQTAYSGAETRISEAAGLGMIVGDAEVALNEAKTSLIQAQASVHTTKLTLVAEHTQDVINKADAASGIAQGKIDESTSRRAAMVIIVLLVLLNCVALYVTKRRLDRDLPAER
jgi:hypothetical protein